MDDAAGPRGQTLLSFGLNLTRVGSLTTDDYGFANATSTTGSGGSTTTDPGSSTPTDATPPDTSIATHPADPTTATTASFSFTSTEANPTFRCTLDGAATACGSPHDVGQSRRSADAVAQLPRVAATDPAGNTDPTPATFDWSVQPPVTSSCGNRTDWVAPQVQQGPDQLPLHAR